MWLVVMLRLSAQAVLLRDAVSYYMWRCKKTSRQLTLIYSNG
eukprot:COSAG06_NODE_6686_length_2826_cov_2.453245_4_plen_42_part_00